MKNVTFRALLALLFGVSCTSTVAPPIDAESFPVFDSAFVCRIPHVNPYLLYDPIDIERNCVPIDAVAFRELILAARPGDEPGPFWKGGHLAIARSQRHGDKYFLIRSFSPDFVRPGVPGSYSIPAERATDWDRLVNEPVRSHPAQVR
jgi:hypothetical protein